MYFRIKHNIHFVTYTPASTAPVISSFWDPITILLPEIDTNVPPKLSPEIPSGAINISLLVCTGGKEGTADGIAVEGIVVGSRDGLKVGAADDGAIVGLADGAAVGICKIYPYAAPEHEKIT